MKKLPCGANLKRDFLRFYKRNSFKNAMPNTQYFAILKKNALFPCEIAGPNWLIREKKKGDLKNKKKKKNNCKT
jgi:hypothetical protein